MATSLSSWAADLYLQLDKPADSRPTQAMIQAALKSAIRGGRLPGGTKLPPTRVLAKELDCSRSVIVAVYGQLVAEGYLESRQGSGTTVALSSAPLSPDVGCSAPELPTINFSAGVNDLSSFPRTDWQDAVGHVMATVSTSELYYAAPVGSLKFRAVLMERLARVRGVAADPRNIHACAGTVQAISLLARALVNRGHTAVAVEDPSWPRLRPPFEGAKLRIAPVSVDDQGLVVSELDRHPDVRVVLTTPAHQFPTGIVMSADRRAELVAWANRNQGLIVEDDYDAEFNLGSGQVGALQGSDPSRVVYLGTTSKILSPALRLGWMATPAWLTQELNEIRPVFDLGVSVIEQLAIAHLMTTGKLDRHLRQTRQKYKRRRELLIDALCTTVPGVTITGAPAGLHLIANLPHDVDENRVVSEAAKRSVGVFGLEYYCLDRTRARQPALVLGYANLTEDSIRAGVDLLAKSIIAAARPSRRSR